ncbi:hypothetical protein F66182_3230 [Fusarium sp. NRRL 66182]|nr:hypothetical protein F66182_3230 [Fusarium sp. NRRL 66182]
MQTKTSLHKLCIENPWLYKHPLAWTGQHVDLVGCSFFHVSGDDNSPPASPAPQSQKVVYQDDKELEPSARQARRFALSSTPGMKMCAIGHLLAFPAGQLVSAGDHPVFSFAGRKVHAPECYLFALRSALLASPFVGYYHYDTVAWERRRKFIKIPTNPGRGGNLPVARLCQRRLKKATPPRWSEDPYLVCILLALAQAQAQACKGPSSHDTFTTRLLVTTEADKTNAHVFKAIFPSTLLKTLSRPTLDHVAWPVIQHTQVCFEPYASFGERIASHLLDCQGATSRGGKRKLEESPPRVGLAARRNICRDEIVLDYKAVESLTMVVLNSLSFIWWFELSAMAQGAMGTDSLVSP